MAAQVLRNLDINLDKARNEILKELDPNFAPPDGDQEAQQEMASGGGSGSRAIIRFKNDLSDAFRIMLTRVAREKALPFEPLVPNETTIAAMREARVGNLKSFDSVGALMADLHAED